MVGGRPRVPREVRRLFWVAIVVGMSPEGAAAHVGVSQWLARRWFNHAGGVIPANARPSGAPESSPAPQGRRLTLADREEIAYWHAQELTPTEIASRVGFDRSTVYRELSQGTVRERTGYRASVAQAVADENAERAKEAKLATNLRLRREVQNRLKLNHSPRQIAERLPVDFPDDPEMRVCHETIYQALYVQARGGLKRELTTHLRTGRKRRKPRRHQDGQQQRATRFPDMVMIADRPPEVDDRKIPGHWEGDLIMGSTASNSAIGTLVERTTRFTMLLHLPNGYHSAAVQEAMMAKMATLPTQLRRSLTWDQGKEMANHAQIADATGLKIYFCDPHSPWQRGSNENTNGLLRQYFPKGTDLSFYGAGYLDHVAAELNGRPRETLGWATPAEALDKLLCDPSNPDGVALTG